MDKGTLKKEEIKKQKDEEKNKKEEEILKKVKEIDLSTKNMKIKRENMSENFNRIMKEILPMFRNKFKNDKVFDELFMSATRLIEIGLSEKDLVNFQDKLNPDEKADLIRYFHMFYDRFNKKLNCGTLKPAKVFGIHQGLLEKEGVGIVGRALFAIQK